MDDFEKNFPGFDWKNTPAYKHPGGKDCPCPKHEYIREQINVAKTMSENNKETSPELLFVAVAVNTALPLVSVSRTTSLTKCYNIKNIFFVILGSR